MISLMETKLGLGKAVNRLPDDDGRLLDSLEEKKRVNQFGRLSSISSDALADIG